MQESKSLGRRPPLQEEEGEGKEGEAGGPGAAAAAATPSRDRPSPTCNVCFSALDSSLGAGDSQACPDCGSLVTVQKTPPARVDWRQ